LSKALSQVSANTDSDDSAEFDIDSMVKEIQTIMTNDTDRKSISQAEWGRQYGVSEKSLSLIRNHQRRKENVQETASKKTILRLAEQLGINCS
jgi:hypothetical protein